MKVYSMFLMYIININTFCIYLVKLLKKLTSYKTRCAKEYTLLFRASVRPAIKDAHKLRMTILLPLFCCSGLAPALSLAPE